MRKALSVFGLVAAAAVLAACGTVAASDTPPETMAMTTDPALAPSTTTTASSPTTSAPVPTAVPDPNAPPTTRVPVPPPTTTPPLPTTTTQPPAFEYTVNPVTADVVSETWREGCPLHWEDLSLLTLRYWDFAGKSVTGEMVVNSSVVTDVVTAFRDLYDIGFPIERMQLVDDYGGDDKAAMRANVTASFNCRYVDGTENWSNHAFGLAVDINPLINPWAREGNVLPLEGTRYADRTNPIRGMINIGDEAITIFEKVGWSWGGVWASADYMHFSDPGN